MISLICLVYLIICVNFGAVNGGYSNDQNLISKDIHIPINNHNNNNNIRELIEEDCDENDPKTLLRSECQHITLEPTLEITSKPTYRKRHIDTVNSNIKDNKFRLSTGYDFSDTARYSLKSDDGQEYDLFGATVALSKHLAVVGAYQNKDAGAVYVYILDHPEILDSTNEVLEWRQSNKLTPQDLREDDNFGYSMAINDRTIYIGSFKADKDKEKADTGCVYVFAEMDTGDYYQQHRLTSFKAAANEYFGYAIATEDKFTIISAYGNSDKGLNAGVVYVFVREENTVYYGNQARIYPSDARANMLFGTAVSISNLHVVVGAQGDDQQGPASGSAYVYTYISSTNSWEKEYKLMAENSNQYDYFGCAVAIDHDTVAIGAYLADGVASTTGVVYIFTRYEVDTGYGETKEYWRQLYELMPPDGHPNSFFGHSVALSNGMLLVGSPGDGTIASASGSTYAYEVNERDEWSLVLQVDSPVVNGDDEFGCDVALYDDVAIIGASKGSGYIVNSGVAYIYTPLSEYTESSLSSTALNPHHSSFHVLLEYVSKPPGEYMLLVFMFLIFIFSLIVAVLLVKNRGLAQLKSHSSGMYGLPNNSMSGSQSGMDQEGTALDISNLYPDKGYPPGHPSFPSSNTSSPTHNNFFDTTRNPNVKSMHNIHMNTVGPRLDAPPGQPPSRYDDFSDIDPAALDLSNASISAMSWQPTPRDRSDRMNNINYRNTNFNNNSVSNINNQNRNKYPSKATY